MTKKYDILVFIGRMQPLHKGHERVINHALTLADNVLILVGSANRAPSIRNPFTYLQRKNIIANKYDTDRVIIQPLNDIMYNDNLWIEQVQKSVNSAILNIINKDHKYIHLHGINDAKIGLIGCQKDESSYYLKLFPTWEDEGVPFYDPINATDIRNAYFNLNNEIDESEMLEYVSDTTYTWLQSYRKTTMFQEIVKETDFVVNYKETIKKYPRIEHTVDAVVVQSGHILLIRRRSEPGKGLWALPGGFLNPSETLEEGMLRELREETKIKVPEPVLRGNIVKSQVFDNPHRSERARIITQAFLINLPRQEDLPKVKGSDDADKAKWVPLANLKADNLFEDHFFIIQKMIGKI
jgi:bifunctional NMN adenylyltransferase/nudix hydrolase